MELLSSPTVDGPMEKRPLEAEIEPETPLDGPDVDVEDDDEEDDEGLSANQNAASLLEDSQALFSGFLKKKGEHRRTWKKRWFVLRPSRLSYYKNEKEYELLSIIRLDDITSISAIPSTSRPLVFGLVTRSRTYYLQAPNEGLFAHWLGILSEAHSKVKRNSPNMTRQDQERKRLSGPRRTESESGRDFMAARSVSPPENVSGFDSGIHRTYSKSVPNSSTRATMPRLSMLDFESVQKEEITQTLRSPPSTSSSLLTAATTVTTNTTLVTDQKRQDGIVANPGILMRSGTQPVPIQASVSFRLPNTVHTSPMRQIVSENLGSSLEDERQSSSGPQPGLSVNTSPEMSPVEDLRALKLTEGLQSNQQMVSSDEEIEFEPETPGIFTSDRLDGDMENPDAILKCGFLKKQSLALGKPFKKRWFVLRKTHILTVYKSTKEYVALHVIPLSQVLDVLDIDPLSSKSQSFWLKIVDPNREFILSTKIREERDEWVRILRSEMAIAKAEYETLGQRQ